MSLENSEYRVFWVSEPKVVGLRPTSETWSRTQGPIVGTPEEFKKFHVSCKTGGKGTSAEINNAVGLQR